MLQLALKANLPLIKVETTDTLNIKAVLEHLAGVPVGIVDDKHNIDFPHYKYRYVYNFEIKGSMEALYNKLVEEERTLILVNYDEEEDTPLIFNAGKLPTPKPMLHKLLSDVLEDDLIAPVAAVLGGLTLKEVSELCRLTQAMYGALTPTNVVKIRRQVVSQMRGIEQVDTTIPFYFAPPEVQDWVNNNGNLFLQCEEERLIPKGLLLDGEPGTGKTLAAKAIADALGIPLYLLDLGSIMGKYHGESEHALNQALQQLDQEEPAVVLLDEIEKLFQKTDDSGVTARLLGKLLWWLQERTSRLLIVMTTNDAKALPPELYREGRVDSIITFQGMPADTAKEFLTELLDTFMHIPEVKHKKKDIKTVAWGRVSAYCKEKGTIPQAKATNFATAIIKKLLNSSYE